MDLQTTGRKPVTSQDVRPANNFRAYSQQTADSTDVTRSQPNTTPAPTTLQQCQHADIDRKSSRSAKTSDPQTTSGRIPSRQPTQPTSPVANRTPHRPQQPFSSASMQT